MRQWVIRSLIMALALFAGCIDRITIPIPAPSSYPVVVDGYISDEPGPYRISVSRAFDIESKLSLRTPISVGKLELHDNVGNKDELYEIDNGDYQTHLWAIRGIVGRVYTLRIELLDGRVYESIPDTLRPGGTVDSVYFRFKSEAPDGVTKYSFDIYFDATERNDKAWN